MKIDKANMAANAQSAADFLKSLGNPNRLMIMCALLEGERSVGELNEEVPLSQSALSQHLSVLRDAGLVGTRRESRSIYYHLADPGVVHIMRPLYNMFCR